MIQDIYEPLDEYVSVFRDKFRQVAEETFDQLAKEAGINPEQNRNTCKALYQFEKDSATLGKQIQRWAVLRDIMWILVAIGLYFVIFKMQEYPVWLISIIGVAVVAIIVLLFWKVRPIIKRKQNEQQDVDSAKKKMEDEAWEQMNPLNALYDWDVFTRIITRTVPRIEFDRYFI